VILAAGAWSARVPDVPAATMVAPARGQMFAVRPDAQTCGHVLQHGDACLVPTRAGELLVGSLVEDAGFTKTVTADGLATLVRHLGDLAPAARSLGITRMWSGLRPFREGGPFIDRHPQLENVVVATGHHRNGILLAPITATRVKDILDGVPPAQPVPSVDLDE
jgi:glycine oxidase